MFFDQTPLNDFIYSARKFNAALGKRQLETR